MNRLLKNVDIKLFLLNIFIVAIVGIYAVFSTPYDIDTSNSSPVTVHSDSLLDEQNQYYDLDSNQKAILLIVETLIVSFMICFFVFYYFRLSKNNSSGSENIQENLNQYMNILEKTNKELVETKEELNQQNEVLIRTRHEFLAKEQKYNLILKSASISIFEWNITENTVTVSNWLKDMLPIRNATINSKEFLELMPEEFREIHINSIYEFIERKKGQFHIEEKYRLKDGSYEWFEIFADGVFSEEGIMVKICGSIENVNQQKLNKVKIQELEYTDYLTGLPNRKALYEKATQALAERQYNDKLFLILIDIDDLGVINNEVGNTVGDEILKVVANRIRSSVNEPNFVARLCGDEFVILTFNINSIDAAHKKVTRILKEFEKPFFVGDNRYYMTASIGITVAPDDGLEAEFLIKNATEAMNKAKEVGKNTYSFYTESINRELIEKLDIISSIKLGIERDEFFLIYQPQYNINTGKIVGFETLLRWNHPSKGIVYPMDFLPIAEENGLIVNIGEKVLIKACNQAELWENSGFCDLTISLNISSRQFYDKNFYNMLKAVADSRLPKTNKINFEIGENIIFQDTSMAINIIKKVEELGYTFNIHNVGNNLLSIINIEQLPIKSIKISGDFTATQLKSNTGHRLLDIFIKLAAKNGFKIIAEGIEGENQLDFFKSKNCNIAQGYYLSKPVDDSFADELLAQEFLI